MSEFKELRRLAGMVCESSGDIIVAGKIFEGREVLFPQACKLEDVKCSRCGGNKLKVFFKKGGNMCFCLEAECLKKDSVIREDEWFL